MVERQVEPVLQARHLRKEFPGVVALADASLTLLPGEVHALLGENGAGKSTLMKTIAGLHRPDGGELLLDGKPVALTSPRDARERGVATIYQEFSLVPDLSIAENLFLGAEPLRFGRLPDFAEMRTQARALLERLGLALDPSLHVRTLSVAEQQLVEIARSLRRSTRILTMDEPTAALSHREAERLFELVTRLAKEGTAILYVSHRLAEVFRLCARATVLRDGTTVAEVPLAGMTEDRIVALMVGRELSELFPHVDRERRDVRLRVRGLSRGARFSGVDIDVRGGEIVGLAGLVGAGRTEVVRAIFGADARDAGTVEIDGEPLAPADPAASVAAGLGLLTEDRKHEGLALGRSIRENTSLAVLDRLSRASVVVDEERERAVVSEVSTKLRVRMPGIEADVAGLSGGNQQKVLLGRWLLTEPKVLLVDEPTRGIDVGARAEIYEQIAQLAARGLAILVVSSDMPEVLGLCDRVLVMADGRIAGELSREQASEEAILQLATPGKVAKSMETA